MYHDKTKDGVLLQPVLVNIFIIKKDYLLHIVCKVEPNFIVGQKRYTKTFHWN